MWILSNNLVNVHRLPPTDPRSVNSARFWIHQGYHDNKNLCCLHVLGLQLTSDQSYSTSRALKAIPVHPSPAQPSTTHWPWELPHHTITERALIQVIICVSHNGLLDSGPDNIRWSVNDLFYFIFWDGFKKKKICAEKYQYTLWNDL